MLVIEISIKSDRKDIVEFLEELHNIINCKEFNIDKHFLFIRSRKEDVMFSTPFTMADLDYDSMDVIERLRELTVSDYSETLFDKDDGNPPLLFVFGKDINDKEVYIKLKIRGMETRKVLCVSFHYAKYKMAHPYA